MVDYPLLNLLGVIVALIVSASWAATNLIYASNYLGRYVPWHSVFHTVMVFAGVFYFGYLGFWMANPDIAGGYHLYATPGRLKFYLIILYNWVMWKSHMVLRVL